MVEMIASAGHAANAAVSALPHLRDLFNSVIWRQELVSENQNRLALVQEMIRLSLEYVDDCIASNTIDRSVRLHWNIWRVRLQSTKDNCEHISSEVQSGSIFGPVHHARQILNHSRERVREFLHFAELQQTNMNEMDANQSVPQSELSFIAQGTVPLNPPRLTLDYNSPDTFEGKLRIAVVEPSRQRVLAVMASGRGGVGKTCALRGLVHDTSVQSMFPDGVQFMKLGKGAVLSTLINEIARIVELTGNSNRAEKIRNSRKLQEAVNLARVWFGSRKCLFLIDDVWKQNGFDGDTFYVLAEMINADSRLVYTTRDSDLALKAEKLIEFQPRNMEDSRDMFMAHAELQNSLIAEERNIEALQAILDTCAGIPLLLAVAGAGVRKYSGRVKGPKENALSAYHGRLKSSPEAPYEQECDGYGPVSNVVETSISVLESGWETNKEPGNNGISIRDMHQSLCVLEKRQEVPVSMLRVLWGLSDERRTLDVMNALNEVAVVEVLHPEDGDERKSLLRVHDDILDVLLACAKDNKKKYFERLLNNYLPGFEVHSDSEPKRISPNAETAGRRKSTGWSKLKRLCCWRVNSDEEAQSASYAGGSRRGEDIRREWWNLGDDDGYLEDNLCRLLRGAEKFEELIWLLLKPQWLMKRLQKGGIFAVEQDISIGIGVVQCGNMERKEETKRSLEVIAHAVRLSHNAVAENAREMWYQLYGRLLQHSKNCETTSRFIEEVAHCAVKPWAKPGIGILTAAGGVDLGTIAVDGRVGSIVNSDSVVKICSYKSRQVQITTYNVKYGSRRELNWTLNESEEQFSYAALSGNGAVVVSGHQCAEYLVQLRRWDATSGEETGMLGLTRSDEDILVLECLAIGEDGNLIACGTRNKLIIWDLRRGNVPCKMLNGPWVNCVAVCSNKNTIAFGTTDGEVRICNAESGSVLECMTKHSGMVNCMALSPMGDLIASASSDETVRIWNAENGAAVASIDVGHAVRCVAFTAVGEIMSVQDSGVYDVWKHDVNGAVRESYHGRVGNSTECLSVSVDGKVGFFGSTDVVQMRELRSGNRECVWDAEEQSDTILCHDVSATGRSVVTGSNRGAICLWNAEQAQASPLMLGTHDNEVSQVALDEGARRVVSGSNDGVVRVWDVDDGTAVCEALTVGDVDVAHSGKTSVAISADGTRVASVARDHHMLSVWQLPPFVGGQAERRMHVQESFEVHDVAISADGERVAAMIVDDMRNVDDVLRVWEVRTGSVTHQFRVSDWYDWRVSFSRNGTQVIAVNSTGQVHHGRLFDMEHKCCIATSEQPSWEDTISSVPFWPPLPQPEMDTFTINSEQGHLILGTPDNPGPVHSFRFGFCQIAKHSTVCFCRLVQK